MLTIWLQAISGERIVILLANTLDLVLYVSGYLERLMQRTSESVQLLLNQFTSRHGIPENHVSSRRGLIAGTSQSK